MDAGRTGRTAVRRAFRAAVGTTVVDTGRARRAAVRGSFRGSVGSAVVHAGAYRPHRRPPGLPH
ncbi:hypothetical protein GA0115236_143111, partial [Streptomyces sp. IgraMP-1]